jgi:hypothetical protein
LRPARNQIIAPMPASSMITLTPVQTIVPLVGTLLTSGSDGKLLV